MANIKKGDLFYLILPSKKRLLKKVTYVGGEVFEYYWGVAEINKLEKNDNTDNPNVKYKLTLKK